MKRELTMVLLGAALLVPVDVEAQRARGRAADADGRVEKLEPITRGGRVAPRARPARVRVRPGRVADRVVYSSHSRYRAPRYHRSGRIGRPYRDARIRVRFDWGLAPIVVRDRVYLDRRLNPGQLRRVLGHATVNEIRRAGRRAGLRGAPRGHWLDSRRHGRVLVVTMDRIDVAEFIDYDRDGWIDDAFFFRDARERRWIDRP